ncbi:alpha/beta fold hydrolase [Aeromicrobium sp. CTD01-1L150]|uniref:alpha/beta fold hydrolase n=1 Tax=Aeromicrobium sp. CTD01-1L150 TaxID=3341830 RepID=UPI0035C02BF2
MQTLDLVGAEGVEFGHGVHLDTLTAGTGSRPALVLPGAERVQEDGPFVTALTDEFSVVLPSHPGFGRSERPDWCNTVADLADVYLAWLDRTDQTDVTLVGLQFGGWVALEIAVRGSTRISQLVLVDTVGVKFGAPRDREITDVFATIRADVERLTYADPSRGLGPPEDAAIDDVLEVMRNEEALAVYGWEPYLHSPRLEQSLSRIAVPTSVIWGTEDGIVSPPYGRAIADRIPGAQFHQLDAAGHRAQVDRPTDVAALITRSVA